MSHSKGVLLGAILGGVAAASAVAFLRTKKGKRLKRDLWNRCDICKEKVEDIVEDVQEKVKSFTGGINENASGFSQKASDVLDFVTDEISLLTENEETRNTFIVGGLVGSLVGAGAAILLSAGVGKEDGGNIAKKIGSQIGDWKKVFQEVASAGENRSEPVFKGHKSSETINEVLDLACGGIRLWNQLKNRK